MTYSIPGDYRTKVQTSTNIGDIDSPFTRTRAVLDMMKGWEIMKAVNIMVMNRVIILYLAP